MSALRKAVFRLTLSIFCSFLIGVAMMSSLHGETIIYDKDNFIIKTNCELSDSGLVFYGRGRAELWPNLCGCFHIELLLSCDDDGGEMLLQIKKRNSYNWLRHLGTDGYWGRFEIDSLEHFRQQNPIVFDFWGVRPLILQEVKFERIVCRPDTLIPDTLFTAKNMTQNSVRATWDPNAEFDLAGYRIYWGGFGTWNYLTWLDVGLSNNNLIGSFEHDRYYWMSVTSYDTAGNESDFSYEVKFMLKAYSLEGDKDNDGKVDFMDAYYMAIAMFSTYGNVNYDPFWDFDNSGEIDFIDRYYFVRNCYGKEK